MVNRQKVCTMPLLHDMTTQCMNPCNSSSSLDCAYFKQHLQLALHAARQRPRRRTNLLGQAHSRCHARSGSTLVACIPR